MVECGLQLLAALVEEGELMSTEVVEVITVGAHEVREHRARDDSVLMFQSIDELLHVFLRVEAETVHAGVELDMYRPSRDTFFLSGFDEGVEEAERVDLRLEVVVEHRLESRHLRVHDHDVRCDAVTAQRSTLIGDSHGEVVDTVVLQRLGNLHTAGTVSVSFDHAHELRLGFHE